jgi:hypothetical protein
MASPPRQPLGLTKDSTGDRIEERTEPSSALRWSFILTGFMRVLALLWILKGLSAWAAILGIWIPAGAFETRSTGYQTTIIYFAVIDLVAAVGLWMASTWGGVMWLLSVMSHLILAAFFPRIISGGVITMTFFLALVAAYLVLSWLSAQDT